MNRRALTTTALAMSLLATPAGAYRLADDAPLPSPATALVAATPLALVTDAIAHLEDFVASGGATNPQATREFLTVLATPLFDFEGFGRFSAGRLASRLSDEQMDGVVDSVRAMFLDALAQNLGTFVDPMPQVRIRPVRSSYENQAQVRAHVSRPGAPPVVLDFRLYRHHDGWRVFDVSANGNSAATYFRALVQREWRRDGLAWLLSQ